MGEHLFEQRRQLNAAHQSLIDLVLLFIVHFSSVQINLDYFGSYNSVWLSYIFTTGDLENSAGKIHTTVAVSSEN